MNTAAEISAPLQACMELKTSHTYSGIRETNCEPALSGLTSLDYDLQFGLYSYFGTDLLCEDCIPFSTSFCC